MFQSIHGVSKVTIVANAPVIPEAGTLKEAFYTTDIQIVGQDGKTLDVLTLFHESRQEKLNIEVLPSPRP